MSVFSDAMAASAVPALLAEHADSVTRRIAGDSENTETVTAIVDLSKEAGDRDLGAMDGDGGDSSTERGRRRRRTLFLEVADTQSTDDADVYVVDGELWWFKRVISRDGGMMRLLFVKTVGITTRKGRTRP